MGGRRSECEVLSGCMWRKEFLRSRCFKCFKFRGLKTWWGEREVKEYLFQDRKIIGSPDIPRNMKINLKVGLVHEMFKKEIYLTNVIMTQKEFNII